MRNTFYLIIAILLPIITFSQSLSESLDFSIVKKGNGYYIDNNNVKYSGKITLRKVTFGSFYKFTPPELRIKTEDGKKSIITLENLKQIVIVKDTFKVVSNFEMTLYDGKMKKIIVPFDFIQMVRQGKINVFKHFYYTRAYSNNNKNSNDEYFQKSNGSTVVLNDQYMQTLRNKKQKIKILNLIKDDKGLYQEWEMKKKYKFWTNIYDMVDAYNSTNK